MKNLLRYRDYNARVEFDAEDELFVGHVIGTPESITFQGSTVAELTADFRAAIEHYIQDCAATGREPHKPYSGKLMLRVPPEVHAHAATMALAHGKSLNQWAAVVLASAR